MIQRVYEQALKAKSLDRVCVATDDSRIAAHLDGLGCRWVMTSAQHSNGTERCLEALNLQQETFDYVINVQGDEPFIDPGQIDLLASVLDGKTQLATLAKKVTDPDLLDSPNCVKVIFNKENEALYFSRTCIPYVRGADKSDWLNRFDFYKHIGIYGYRADVLSGIVPLPPGRLEMAEALEQLRWLENGYRIKVVETEVETIGIDSPEDIGKARKLYRF